MSEPPTTFAGLVQVFLELISLAVTVVFALTIVYLSWKLINAWVLHPDEPESVENGKKIALIGAIALVCMVGVWTIVRLVQDSFGL